MTIEAKLSKQKDRNPPQQVNDRKTGQAGYCYEPRAF